MKLSFILWTVVMLQAFATGYSQTARISLSMHDVKIEDVLDKIEEQSEFYFLYNQKLVDLSGKVSINVSDKSINEVLNVLFDKEQIDFAVYDRQIIVSPAGIHNVSEQEQAMLRQQLSMVGMPILSEQGQAMLQQITINGTVTDEADNPLPGTSVKIKGATQGTTTDVNGAYSLPVPDGNTTLIFSYIGFATQEIIVGSQRRINVTLIEDTRQIEEVVVVGYGSQKRGNVTGSIATIHSEKLTVSPIASTTNALAGLLPGLISKQTSGLPGSDAASLSIRGFGGPLVIVDGIEMSFNNIDANQIETISILKDGAASIYGARAGNGVILVTTKRGTIGKPTISLNMAGTVQGVTIIPTPLNAGQFAEFRSEMHLNNGGSPNDVPFTPEEIRKYYEGTDPLYPNTNWAKELIRNWAPQQQYNLSLRGGTEAVKYYGFIGYLDQTTMFKHNGGGYKRYNFQSNVDAKITDNLSLEITVNGIYDDNNQPHQPFTNDGSFWDAYWSTMPIYPARLPDPTKISYAWGSGTGGAHITGNRAISGYNDSDRYTFKGTMAFNYKFSYIEGLSAKLFMHYAKEFNGSKSFIKPVTFYTYDPGSGIYSLAGNFNNSAQMSVNKGETRTVMGYFSLNYDRIFAEKHHVTAMALYEAIDNYGDFVRGSRINFMTPSIEQLFAGSTEGWSNDGSAWENGRASYVGRLNYAFMGKYIFESIFRADASSRYRSDVRWGYFPSISLGWRLSEEYFIKNMGFIDNLKLRASHGRSGDDSVAEFQYLSGYNLSGTYLFGNEQVRGLVSTRIANPYLTWMEIAISNLGLDFSFLKNRLYGEFDVFYRELTGIPARRTNTLPSTFGASLPQENMNSQNTRGFELKLGTVGRINDFSYDVSGNISWSRAKWMDYDEPEYDDPDRERIYKVSGRWTDRIVRLKTDGIFTSQQEIDDLTFDMDQRGNVTLRPGDIRYVNSNGDDVLDWKDMVEVGKGTTPHWMCGFNINMKYKNLDFSSLFQGSFGFFTTIESSFMNNMVPQFYFNNRWTPENNKSNALFPRTGISASNAGSSDFYYKNAGYLRLKNFSLGYNFPKDLLHKANIQQVRVYLAGTNLITFDRLKKYQLDPESPSGLGTRYYPQQRTISLGLNLSF